MLQSMLVSSLPLLFLLTPNPITAHAHKQTSHHHLNKARNICSARSGNSSLHCILAPEATEGPYYISHPLVRFNITEDRPGVPFTLRVSVVDVTNCEPVEGVYVDIWHADALGRYSGWAEQAELGASHPSSAAKQEVSETDDNDHHHGTPSEDDDHHGPPGDHDGYHGPPGGGKHGGGPPNHAPNDGSRWLRGVQLTASSGTAIFSTVFPGWYMPRTTHIHVRVHTGNASVSEAADADSEKKHLVLDEAGRTAHTGQFFFSDSLVQRIAENELPYSEHLQVEKPTFNSDDGIYLHSGGGEQLMVVEANPNGDGLTGYITVGIDPSADRTGDEDGRGPHGPHFGKEQILGLGAVVCVALIGGWGLMRGVRWLKQRRERREGYIVLE